MADIASRIAELDHLLANVVPNLPGCVPTVQAVLEERRAELVRAVPVGCPVNGCGRTHAHPIGECAASEGEAS